MGSRTWRVLDFFGDDKAWQSYPTVVCWKFYRRFDSWPIPNLCHPLDLFMANLREVARANNDSSGYVKSNKTNLFKGAFKAWVSHNNSKHFRKSSIRNQLWYAVIWMLVDLRTPRRPDEAAWSLAVTAAGLPEGLHFFHFRVNGAGGLDRGKAWCCQVSVVNEQFFWDSQYGSQKPGTRWTPSL